MTKVLNEQEGKLLAADGKINQLEQQLAKIKQAREEIYEKHMISRCVFQYLYYVFWNISINDHNPREQYRAEYEEKLKKELEQMRIQMDFEIDKLKANVKEVSEREARQAWTTFSYLMYLLTLLNKLLILLFMTFLM